MPKKRHGCLRAESRNEKTMHTRLSPAQVAPLRSLLGLPRYTGDKEATGAAGVGETEERNTKAYVYISR